MTKMFKLTRTMGPERGKVFFAMPFGTKEVNGVPFDFDAFYHDECVPVVRDDCGMEPVRGDEIYGSQGVLETVWRAMQQADLVVADFTARSPNVALEFGWALLLGKRVILLTQDPDDIPTDVRGLYRYTEYSQNFKHMRRMREDLALNLKEMSQEPAEEMALMPMMPMVRGSMTSVPARVILAEREYVVVQDDSGRRGVMGNNDVDYARIIKDMSRRYPVGTHLDGAFVVDPMRSEMRYTLLGKDINPWPLLLRRFPVGTTLSRRVVRTVDNVGVFLHLEDNINGLVPWSQFNGILPQPGTELQISVAGIDEHKRQVSLRLNRPIDLKAPPDQHTGRFASVGWQGYGEVVRAEPERPGRGGFILLRLPTTDRPAMLLVKDMTEDLHHDLNNGQVDIGEEIKVEVLSVNIAARKTLLRELPESDEEQGLQAA